MLAAQSSLDCLDFKGYHADSQLQVDNTNVFEDTAFEVPAVNQVRFRLCLIFCSLCEWILWTKFR
jgi:hypothetical protein